MFELTIYDKVYQFHFGMGFLREINKKVSIPVEGVPGVKKEVGLRYTIARVIDGDMEALIDILDLANKGQAVRITRNVLDAFVEEETTDIDALFERVQCFLENANATRKETTAVLKAVKQETAKQKQK